jgi:hypothetical protein
MTAEGYPLGTQCWYMSVAYRSRGKNRICGNTQEDTLHAVIDWFKERLDDHEE